MHLASLTPETINSDFEVLKPQSDVEEINSLYAVCEASRPAFEKAIELGRLLNRAKEKAGRHWTEWAEKNLTFTVRTASNYMRLVKNEPLLLSENVSDLNTAYKMISKPKKEKVEPKDPLSAEQKEVILRYADELIKCLKEFVPDHFAAAANLVLGELKEAKRGE
jgi:Protein of unknown function (DUF3102)